MNLGCPGTDRPQEGLTPLPLLGLYGCVCVCEQNVPEDPWASVGSWAWRWVCLCTCAGDVSGAAVLAPARPSIHCHALHSAPGRLATHTETAKPIREQGGQS